MKQRLTSPLQSSKYRQYSSEKYKFNTTPYESLGLALAALHKHTQDAK